jgi:hypothetical protein
LFRRNAEKKAFTIFLSCGSLRLHHTKTLLSMEGVMMFTSASATSDLWKDSNLHPLVELAAKHTREFECRLAAIQNSVGVNASQDAAAGDSSAPKPSVDENRLAANVMLALSKARPGGAPNLTNAERQVPDAVF